MRRLNYFKDYYKEHREHLIAYSRIHLKIRKMYGNANKCAINNSHIKSRYEWANISGEYRENITDWIQLCAGCHRTLDRLKMSIEDLKNREALKLQILNSL